MFRCIFCKNYHLFPKGEELLKRSKVAPLKTLHIFSQNEYRLRIMCTLQISLSGNTSTREVFPVSLRHTTGPRYHYFYHHYYDRHH